MKEWKSIEVDKWSEPDERHRVEHSGMMGGKEVYEQLKAHLEKKGMLPEEYFLLDRDIETLPELPDYDFALCIPNYGGSEGVYLDICLFLHIKGRRECKSFITGKTLKEGADAFLWMARIAAECSLMLNGRGHSYRQENTELVLGQKEAEYLRNLLQRESGRGGKAEQNLAIRIQEQLNQ